MECVSPTLRLDKYFNSDPEIITNINTVTLSNTITVHQHIVEDLKLKTFYNSQIIVVWQ